MSLRNKIDLEPKLTPFVLSQSEVPRCAINNHGSIIYANESFYQLCDLSPEQDYQVHDVFTFSDDVLNEDDDITELDDGEHDVHIKGNPIITTIQFDRLTSQDGQDYVIASINGDIADTDFDDEELNFLMSRIQSSTARLSHPEAEDLKTEDDAPDNFSAFMDMTHDLMLITDHQGHVVTCNKVFDAHFHQTTSFVDLFHEEERHAIRTMMLGLARESTEESVTFESHMPTKGNDHHWIAWQLKIVGERIYCVGQDITDIKRQKENLNRRQRQLSEAEAIGRMGHWHWIIGEDNISWSEEIFRIFGVDSNQFEPSINALTELVHKRDLGRVVQVFQRAIIEEKDYDMEFRITRPGGDIQYIMCEGRCEKDDTGEVIALYGIMQDMTERMLYEQELREARDASEQAYATKSKFLANMSHELRTPLNAIIGFSEMIENEMLGPISNDKYLEYAKNIHDSGTHLLDIISDILDMSKIEAGKMTLDLEKVNIKDIIDRASHMVFGRANEKQINLQTHDVEESDIDVICDRRALTQIVLNLLSNAIKFTPEGGTVWIECYQRDDYLSLKVCDDGIGIPPNKLASVLRPFEQASFEYTRDHEGSGLGLSITKNLVELHNGTLHIESEVDEGTVVTVRLPYDAKKITV